MKYTDLDVWKQAADFVVDIYRITRQFPFEERYGLASQMQRVAVSIPSNIAEGHGRKLTAVFLNHLSVAYGSLMEVETQLRIAHRLDYVDEDSVGRLLETADHIGRRLTRLKQSLAKEADAG